MCLCGESDGECASMGRVMVSVPLKSDGECASMGRVIVSVPLCGE